MDVGGALSRLCALVIALLASWVVFTSGAAQAIATDSGAPTYNYDAHLVLSVVTTGEFERGPPAVLATSVRPTPSTRTGTELRLAVTSRRDTMMRSERQRLSSLSRQAYLA